MLAAVKNILPLIFYLVGIAFFFVAIAGRTKWPFAFLIFLLPLRNVVEKLHAFPMGKDMVDLILIGLIIGWVTRTLFLGKPFIQPTALNGLMLVVILYQFFSLWIGYDYLNYYAFMDFTDPRVQTWKNFSIMPIVFLLALNVIDDRKTMIHMLIAMGVTMVLMNLYQVRQISWYSSIVSRIKITGTFVFLGPNEIAAFYNMYTIILMSLFFHIRKWLPKLAIGFLGFINLYCILFLFSRAAYLALAVGMFFLFAVKKRILLIPLLMCLIFWQTALPDKVRERIEMTTNEYGELDTSTENRLIIWRESVELFKSSPVVGVGLGVFRFMGFRLGDTHNIYLKILAEQGIIGLFIFLLVVLSFFFHGVRLYLNEEDPVFKGLALGFAIAVIVLVVNNMFGDRWTYMQVSAYLWIIAGFVCRLNCEHARERQQAVREKQKHQTLEHYVQRV